MISDETLSQIFGAFTFIMMFGAVGPVIAGYIFDISGSYQMAFLTIVLVAFIGLFLTILLAKSETKQKN